MFRLFFWPIYASQIILVVLVFSWASPSATSLGFRGRAAGAQKSVPPPPAAMPPAQRPAPPSAKP